MTCLSYLTFFPGEGLIAIWMFLFNCIFFWILELREEGDGDVIKDGGEYPKLDVWFRTEF